MTVEQWIRQQSAEFIKTAEYGEPPVEEQEEDQAYKKLNPKFWDSMKIIGGAGLAGGVGYGLGWLGMDQAMKSKFLGKYLNNPRFLKLRVIPVLASLGALSAAAYTRARADLRDELRKKRYDEMQQKALEQSELETQASLGMEYLEKALGTWR